MTRLAICSRDLHWHWINWTLLCDTMEVSMLPLAWLTTAQHVFQPALTTKAIAVSKFCENCLPRIGSKELPRFCEEYRVLGRQKMGSNMRPRYIQFRDIHDRDISRVHCIGIPMLKIRRFRDLSIFNMGIPITGRRSLYWDRVLIFFVNVWATRLWVHELCEMGLSTLPAYGLILITAWMSNYIHYEMWDEITYPFLNFWSLGMDK